MSRKLNYLLIFLIAYSLELNAQDSSIAIGIRTQIRSKILNENREILISLPEGYSNNKKPYPVIYLLDAEEHFFHVAGIVEFLSSQKRIPPMILVGIPNTKRMRDLTPKTETDSLNKFSISGGANLFAEFLEKELLSFIEKNYRTCPYRILAGHSLGGLFAIHAWCAHTRLFNAYLAVSPS
ncbi:alpha/beta hydrolase, partial [bacterium]|nr:alpha/beta hydrolase [bacterium]